MTTKKQNIQASRQEANAALAKDNAAKFLQQNINAVTDMYLLNLAELTRYKEQHYQQQLLLTQQNEARLNTKISELEKQLHEAITPKVISQVEPPKKPKVQEPFKGWQKIGIDGHELAADVPSWAAIIDKNTKLMWAVNSNRKGNFPNANKRKSFTQTGGWVKQVNKAGWCGYFDWRLPTIDELKTLLLSDKGDNQLFIRSDIFFDISSVQYVVWSSSEIASNCVLIVNFQNAGSFPFTKYGNNYIRLVRSLEA